MLFINIKRLHDFPNCKNLTMRNLAILTTLYEEGDCRIADVLKRLDIEGASLTKNIDTLERLGLAHRRLNRADRREYLLAISNLGREILDRSKAEEADLPELM